MSLFADVEPVAPRPTPKCASCPGPRIWDRAVMTFEERCFRAGCCDACADQHHNNGVVHD